MVQHIGIVGCSAEGAALCYRTLCAEGEAWLGPHAHPEISMHTPSLSHYVSCLERGDRAGIADLMLNSAQKLVGIGADFLICPDNTIHQAFDLVAARSSLPFLHIAEVVAAAAAERGFQHLAIFGTKWLVDSDVYPDKLAALGLTSLRPPVEMRVEISRIIMNELVKGILKPSSIAYCQEALAQMKGAACDAAILGCTELPLIVSDANAPLPVLDSTRLLARAALKRAIS